MTTAACLVNGHLHSPFFLFLRAAGRLSDAELLRVLGLRDFLACPLHAAFSGPRIYFTEDEAWIHIADDWHYSLWHKDGDKVSDELHKAFPDIGLFACSFGDIDRSFDFKYYESGCMVRKHVVEHRQRLHDRAARVVLEDIGQALPDEIAVFDIEDEQEYVLSLAAALGVRLDHDLSQIRCYSKLAR